MRLILAVSADGYLCSGPDDDMSWTSNEDKRLFRVLTSVGSVLAAGRVTAELLKRSGLTLEGRSLHSISRKSCVLSGFARRYPEAWLLGGPTIAMAARSEGLLSEVHLIFNKDVELGEGTSLECLGPLPKPYIMTPFGVVSHRAYRL